MNPVFPHSPKTPTSAFYPEPSRWIARLYRVGNDITLPSFLRHQPSKLLKTKSAASHVISLFIAIGVLVAAA